MILQFTYNALYFIKSLLPIYLDFLWISMAKDGNLLTWFKASQFDFLKASKDFEWWQLVDDSQTASDSLINTTLDKAL